jgi:hypothetical protein
METKEKDTIVGEEEEEEEVADLLYNNKQCYDQGLLVLAGT